MSLSRARLGHAGRIVLDQVDAEVFKGERVLLVGANGAGKSTLLATLAGLVPALSGSVRVLGLDPLQDRRRLHRDTGFLGHRSGLYPELTGRENLSFHAGLRGVDEAEVKRRLQEAGLAGHADRPARVYSNGMKRRLGFAKALLGSPRLLLLDEPDAGLDRAAHEWLSKRLGGLERATILMATHAPQAHVDQADKVWVLGGGRIVEVKGEGRGIARERLDAAMREVEA